MWFMALINYGLLNNTALVIRFGVIHNLRWKWKISKRARENMDDPLVQKFSTNMFYGEMCQKYLEKQNKQTNLKS